MMTTLNHRRLNRHCNQSVEAQQSLDGFTNDIFNDDAATDCPATAAAAVAKTSPGNSDRRLFLAGNSKRNSRLDRDASMDIRQAIH